MAQLKLTSGKGKIKAGYSTFKTAKTAWEGRWDNLSGADKSNAVNIINNWGSATQAQKVEALMASVALLYMAVGYLIWRELGD